jgi:uroporphyrinogen decarboxylase
VSKISPRERFMIAVCNGQPDRVPCTPDISNMIPARLTRRPFWDIYYHLDPPLWRAYIEAIKYFGIDGWFIYGDMGYRYAAAVVEKETHVRRSADRWVVGEQWITPAGEMTIETTYYVADPPTRTVKPIKDLKADWDKVRYLFQEPVGYDPSAIREQRSALGELGAYGLSVMTPGFQTWFPSMNGGIEALTYLYYDEPELIEELRVMHERCLLKQLEMVIDARPDFILTGGSGAITLQSPALARQLVLPTLQEITRLAKEAGIPTMVHSCGYEYELVKMCAEETDLNCINPLEEPPMGDCYLDRIKREFGHKLALMGNLHTTDVMLLGSTAEVERAARKAIDDAAAGGGFILSTGDQCGRDTPDENIFTLVRVCETYGQYH